MLKLCPAAARNSQCDDSAVDEGSGGDVNSSTQM